MLLLPRNIEIELQEVAAKKEKQGIVQLFFSLSLRRTTTTATTTATTTTTAYLRMHAKLKEKWVCNFFAYEKKENSVITIDFRLLLIPLDRLPNDNGKYHLQTDTKKMD